MFYKILTHRPVADIGTFGPRNYASEALLSAAASFNKQPCAPPAPARRSAAKHTAASFEADFAIPQEYRRYVRPDGSVGTRNTLGWYQRNENNGWRPVNEVRMVDGEDQLAASKRERPVFHHDTALRRQERRRLRKQRQREWMVALYRCARFHAPMQARSASMAFPARVSMQAETNIAIALEMTSCHALQAMP